MTSIRSFRWIIVCAAGVTHLAACSTSAVGQQEPPTTVQVAAAGEPEPAALSEGLYTQGQASRGERRFQQLCADCHRDAEITQSWFGGTTHQTASDLLLVMSMTMPETSPGSLSDEDYADILAYLLRLNDYPAGEEELPPDFAVLGNIRIPPP